MSFPLQVATSDRVLAAQVRGALMNGAAWSDVTTLTDNSGGTASDTLAVISDPATKNAVAYALFNLCAFDTLEWE